MVQAKLDYEIPEHLKREFVFQTAGILPPNGLIFGFKTVKKVGVKAAELGCRNALLVTDETMDQLGYADLVRESMEKEDLGIEIFSRVEPEPHIETAEALYALVRRKKFDLIIGLGGGSCLDMAKLTSLMATHDPPPFELISRKTASRPGLKKILIPTTAGSGSEVSRSLVVSAGGRKHILRSPYAYPEVAIIDPGLTLSVPPGVTAFTGVDALAHAVESLMNKLSIPFSDSLAVNGIELIARYLRRAVMNGQDLEARYYLSMGSTSAMISLSGTGGLYTHSISYVLAMFQPLVHGIGCGIALPHTMAFNLPMIEDKLALIARAMGERIESLGSRAAGQRAVERVFDLIRDLKMPQNLKEMGFRREDLPQMADICLAQYPRENNPRPLSREECLALFQVMWEGKSSEVIG